MSRNKTLPIAYDAHGKEITVGCLVRNTANGEIFLVRGFYRQDEGPSQVNFASQCELVEERPDTMAEVVANINNSRDRGHARGGVGAIRRGSGEADGDSIIWGW